MDRLGRWVPAVLLLGVLGAVGGWYAREAQARAAAKAQVAAVLTAQSDAWNNGDLEAFMATYWASDDLRFYSGGDVTKGHAPVLERYRKRYQADGKEMGRLTFSDLEVLVLTGDQAIARGRWEVVMAKETLDGLFTLWLTKRPEGWRIVHDHTSKADPPKKS